MKIKDWFKSYGMSVAQVFAVFGLFTYVMQFTDNYTAKSFRQLNLLPSQKWMFLIVEIISLYVALPVLWRLCLQRSVIRKRQLAGLLSPYLTRREGIKQAFYYRSFWMESLPILLVCSYSRYTRAIVLEMLGIFVVKVI